jgi:hypothetical protein
VDVYDALESVWLAQGIYIAAALGIADHLTEGPMTASQLAALTGSDERSLYRVLRAIASSGIFHEDSSGRFHNNERSDCLRSEVAFSLRHWAVTLGDVWWPLGNHALEAVRTGKSGPQLAGAASLWEIYQRDPSQHEDFIRAMDSFTRWQSHVIVQAFDFGRFRKVVDIGGGRGAMMAEILRANPSLQGVVFDMPETAEHARQTLSEAGLDGRFETEAGSFLESVPAGADAYLIKHVLHDWPDEQVLRILRNCAAAMDEQATLLTAHALLLPHSPEDRITKLTDINYMVTLGGGMRTLDEFQSLMNQAGLELVASHPTRCADLSILEARLSKSTPPI